MRHREPGPSDHRPAGPVDDRLEAEAVGVVPLHYMGEKVLGLVLRHAAAQRIPPERLLRVEDGERGKVVWGEGAQDEPLGREDGYHSNGSPGASAKEGSRPGRAEGA